ncbi:MAG TPA: NAD(P)/FAD-dependent oxidoreductase [Phycisphaerae bacterium]|nr:NAD(P)/FAD-dependent oxidoreductase [Phycisphaerae bacterium]
MKLTPEVIVIGGGPSGSTVATLLAKQGHRVLILERAKFPRHHIGESLIPYTYFTLKKLGMIEKLKASDFVKKESVQFVSASGKDSAPFFFPDLDPSEWSSTWQVTRSKFDQMLLDNARENGVEVIEQANVKEVLFETGKPGRPDSDSPRAIGVRTVIGGETRDIHARVTVDATGQSAMLSRRFKLRYGDEKLKNAVIYGYWTGAQRDEGRNAGATLVIALPATQGWFWFIPLEDGITSVGVVAPPDYLYNGRSDDPEAILNEEIANTPGLARRLTRATRVDKIYTTADFSYRSRRAAGNGWALVGDAFGFLDPLYSSGVMLALKSGELAAEAIHEALVAGDVSEASLSKFGPKVAQGMQRIRMLVYAYYDPTFRMGGFVRQYPHLKNDITRVLVGDVFEDDLAELFDTMARHIKLPQEIQLDVAPVSNR